MSGGRDDLIRRYLLYKQAQAALHEALKREGLVEHTEHKTVPTWKLAFATAAGAQTQDRVVITDTDDFMAYMTGRYPTEIVQRTVTEIRNPDWLARVLENWAISGPEDDGESVKDDRGKVVPGVKFKPGGEFITVGVTAKPAARKTIGKAVERGITMGDWSMVAAIERGDVDLSRPLRGARDSDGDAG
jgi:hypothetical protein